MGRCQTFSSKSGRGRLREVLAYKRFWYFGKLVARRVGRNRKIDLCILHISLTIDKPVNCVDHLVLQT